MDSLDRATLELLDRYRRSPREAGPVPLAETYLRAVSQIEALPENHDGADKTWVVTLVRRSADLWSRAVRVR